MTLREAYQEHARTCAICQETGRRRTLRESAQPGRLAPPLTRARLARETRSAQVRATLVSEQTGVPVMPEGTTKTDDPVVRFRDLYDDTADKFAKEETNYRYSGDPARSCGACVHFIEPGACAKVSGLIRLVDVCDLFEPTTARQVFRSSYLAR